MLVSVRFAEGPADRDAVYLLRSAVYGRELGRDYAMDGQGRMADELDVTARLLLAEQDGEVGGTMRLQWGGDGPFNGADRAIYGLDDLEAVVPADRIMIFSRFATASAFRGSDLPGQLVDAMVLFAIAKGVCVILCDCRPELINLYLGLGMRVRGPVVTTREAGILVPLVLLLDDPAHVAASGSRIASLLRGTPQDELRLAAILSLLPARPVVQSLEHPEKAPGWASIVDTLARTSPENLPIFHGLSAASIARLATRANVIGCIAGDAIVRQGTKGEMVFVVLDGAVDVVRNGQVVARLSPGDVFGEVAFLARLPRTADVVAASNSRLICLRPSVLSALIASEPDVAAPFLFNLSRVLAKRLAGCNATSSALAAFG